MSAERAEASWQACVGQVPLWSGQPDEITACILQLADPAASWGRRPSDRNRRRNERDVMGRFDRLHRFRRTKEPSGNDQPKELPMSKLVYVISSPRGEQSE